MGAGVVGDLPDIGKAGGIEQGNGTQYGHPAAVVQEGKQDLALKRGWRMECES